MHQEAELSYGNKHLLIKQIIETLVSKVKNFDKEESNYAYIDSKMNYKFWLLLCIELVQAHDTGTI